MGPLGDVTLQGYHGRAMILPASPRSGCLHGGRINQKRFLLCTGKRIFLFGPPLSYPAIRLPIGARGPSSPPILQFR